MTVVIGLYTAGALVPRNPDHPSTFVFSRYGKIVSTKAILDKTTNKCKGEERCLVKKKKKKKHTHSHSHLQNTQMYVTHSSNIPESLCLFILSGYFRDVTQNVGSIALVTYRNSTSVHSRRMDYTPKPSSTTEVM